MNNAAAELCMKYVEKIVNDVRVIECVKTKSQHDLEVISFYISVAIKWIEKNGAIVAIVIIVLATVLAIIDSEKRK